MPAKTKSKRPRGKKGSSILAKARRDPRFRFARERDALIEAIRCNQPELASSLLAQGVDPNSTDAKGRSALWHAAHWGRSDLIRDLVQRGARLPDDVLMGPVHDGDAETVRLLIRHGANVNCVAVFTRYSWKFPQKEILLSEAIRHAVLARSVEDAIARHRKSSRPLKRADYEAVPIILIKAGAKVNGLIRSHSVFRDYIPTFLNVAAASGLTRTVKAMLAAGADVNQRDTWGGTALFDAAHEGHREIVRTLLKAGAKTNLKRRHSGTPISIARERGFPEIGDLIEKHASPTAKQKRKR